MRFLAALRNLSHDTVACRTWIGLPAGGLLYNIMLTSSRNYVKTNINFMGPHLGSFANYWRVHQQVVDQLVRFPKVYGDTSGVRRLDYIVQAIKRAGAHKVLFGSDGPWLHPGVELHKIRLLGLLKQEEALVLSGNAFRL